jgi:parallel beta-helix repeat protein
MRPPLLLLAAAVTLVGAAPGPGATLEVFPGPGTPLQDALDAAEDGDTVHVNAGTYPEAVIITKDRLRLIGEGGFIDAGCGAPTALEVAADRVRIEGLAVMGATFYAIDVEDREGVRIENVGTRETCGGAAQYGINVFQSRRVRISRSSGEDFGDAAIYVGAIPEEGGVRVERNLVQGGNARAIIVEDSPPRSVRVVRNQVNPGNGTGIFLHNSDGILIRRNTVGGCTVSGIELDATSDGNVLAGNASLGNAADVLDYGTGNVWRCSNVFASGNVPACP